MAVRAVIVLLASGCSIVLGTGGSADRLHASARPPNVVIILVDDLGYGDLGSYGHPTIRTPVLDRMAAEGQRWTSFYAHPFCTPSRAALLTGRLPIRSGMTAVLFPTATGGLPAAELTIAELLKTRGYATAIIGKWHLGHLRQYLPDKHGFDYFYGLPYSNDMDRVEAQLSAEERAQRRQHPRVAEFNVPLMRNDSVVERPAEQATLTRRYTDEAIAFMKANREGPFFLYLAHTMPHEPLFASPEFQGRSARGVYGDVVEELDHNVGRVLDALRELQVDRRTLVVFLSDNGPDAAYRERGGSAGLLRGAKGSTWEGGVRVPAIFWWPGTILGGSVPYIGSVLDLLPTVAMLTGASIPRDVVLDGYDLSATLRVRHGAFKAVFPRDSTKAVELYDMDVDASERFDMAAQRPEVVTEIMRLVDGHKRTVLPGPAQR